jgi:AraC-like DNA-binding protein
MRRIDVLIIDLTKMTDPLTDILALVGATTHVSVGFAAGGAWAVRTPSHPGLKFNAVVRGSAWLLMEGQTEPVELQPGDCFVLTRGRPFVLATDLALPASDAEAVFEATTDGVARLGEGETFLVYGGRMELDEADAALLLDNLPPVIIVRAASAQAVRMQWLLGEFRREIEHPSMGSGAFVRSLMQLMFIEGMRAGLDAFEGSLTGWAGALADPRIGATLRAIHAQPERAWRHAELAAIAGMSPSTFAAHFRARIGTSPLDYHLQWRMRVAARALRTQEASIASTALSLGYGSDSAFSNAFRRVVGMSPGQYRTKAGTGGAATPPPVP